MEYDMVSEVFLVTKEGLLHIFNVITLFFHPCMVAGFFNEEFTLLSTAIPHFATELLLANFGICALYKLKFVALHLSLLHFSFPFPTPDMLYNSSKSFWIQTLSSCAYDVSELYVFWKFNNHTFFSII